MSTDLEKLAIETAHGIDRDTNTCGFNHNVNLIKSALERAVAAASEDSRRLDWLNSVDGADWFSHCNYGEATRAAIDLAMAQQKGG